MLYDCLNVKFREKKTDLPRKQGAYVVDNNDKLTRYR